MGRCSNNHLGVLVCSQCGYGLLRQHNKNWSWNDATLSLNSRRLVTGVVINKDSFIMRPNSDTLPAPATINPAARKLFAEVQIFCGKCKSLVGLEQLEGENSKNTSLQRYFAFNIGSTTFIPTKS